MARIYYECIYKENISCTSCIFKSGKGYLFQLSVLEFDIVASFISKSISLHAQGSEMRKKCSQDSEEYPSSYAIVAAVIPLVFLAVLLPSC